MNTGKLSFDTTPTLGRRLPVEDIQQMNKVLDEKYKTNEAYLDSIENTLNTIKVEDRNNPILEERKITTLNAIKDLRNSGNLEFAGKNVKSIVGNLAQDELFQGAIYSKQLADKADAELDEAYKKNLETNGKQGLNMEEYTSAKFMNKLNNIKPLSRDKNGNVINYFSAKKPPSHIEILDELQEKIDKLKPTDRDYQEIKARINSVGNATVIAEWNRIDAAAQRAGYIDASTLQGVSAETLKQLAISILNTPRINNYIQWMSTAKVAQDLVQLDERGNIITDDGYNPIYKKIDPNTIKDLLKVNNLEIRTINDKLVLGYENLDKPGISQADGKTVPVFEPLEPFNSSIFTSNGINESKFRDLYTNLMVGYMKNTAIDFATNQAYNNLKPHQLTNHIYLEQLRFKNASNLIPKEKEVVNAVTFPNSNSITTNPNSEKLTTTPLNNNNTFGKYNVTLEEDKMLQNIFTSSPNDFAQAFDSYLIHTKLYTDMLQDSKYRKLFKGRSVYNITNDLVDNPQYAKEVQQAFKDYYTNVNNIKPYDYVRQVDINNPMTTNFLNGSSPYEVKRRKLKNGETNTGIIDIAKHDPESFSYFLNNIPSTITKGGTVLNDILLNKPINNKDLQKYHDDYNKYQKSKSTTVPLLKNYASYDQFQFMYGFAPTKKYTEDGKEKLSYSRYSPMNGWKLTKDNKTMIGEPTNLLLDEDLDELGMKATKVNPMAITGGYVALNNKNPNKPVFNMLIRQGFNNGDEYIFLDETNEHQGQTFSNTIQAISYSSRPHSKRIPSDYRANIDIYDVSKEIIQNPKLLFNKTNFNENEAVPLIIEYPVLVNGNYQKINVPCYVTDNNVLQVALPTGKGDEMQWRKMTPGALEAEFDKLMRFGSAMPTNNGFSKTGGKELQNEVETTFSRNYYLNNSNTPNVNNIEFNPNK